MHEGTTSANEVMALAFGYFERLLSGMAPGIFFKKLIEAIPRPDEERMATGAEQFFPYVVQAETVPKNIGMCLNQLKRRATDQAPFLYEFFQGFANAAAVTDT